jgi:hypothetical protein
MIEKRHEVGLKPEHASIAGFASTGLSFLTWAARGAALKSRDARPGGSRDHPHPGEFTGSRASKKIGNRTRQEGSGMTAVKRMAAVAVMAGLLAGPVAAPNQPPGRPRRGSYPWHVVSDWLGYRRQARRESGGTNGRRRNRAR